MNKLTSQDRARILHLLCEGQSIRAITRVTGVSKNTVTKLRMTPAMAAGVCDRLWEVSDIVALIEAGEAKTVAKRGPYKRRAA